MKWRGSERTDCCVQYRKFAKVCMVGHDQATLSVGLGEVPNQPSEAGLQSRTSGNLV
jgi:hypothetical protein